MVAETVSTTKPLDTAAPRAGKLTRLGFVPQYTSFAYSKLGQLYSTGKTYVPKTLQPQVSNLEGIYSKHGVPLVNRVADGGQEVLLLVDGQVDKNIKRGYEAYQKAVESPPVQEANKKFTASRDGVKQKVTNSLDFAKQNGVQGYLQYARLQTLRAIENSLDLAKSVVVGGSNFASSVTSNGVDQLKRALGLAQQQSQNVLNVATEKSQAARNTLVKQPLYKKAYDSSNNLLASAQETAVYKEASKRLYPVVAPIADPAIEKLQPYYENTVAYFKPVSAAA